MGTTNHSVEVDAPLRAVYNQWTQFEEFPHFMEGVESVRQEGNDKLFWRAKIGGKVKEWEAQITEQVPDERIAWQSIDGSPNSGVVTFEAVGPDVTRVTAMIGYEPEGLLEKAGDVLGIPSARVEGDLNRFRDYIEERGRAMDGWRGEIGASQSHDSGTAPVVPKPDTFRPGLEQPYEAGAETERTVGLQPSAASTANAASAVNAASADKVIEVPLSEEEVKVGKRTVEAGEVKLHKTVSSEAVEVPVELKREDVVVEHIQAHEVEGAVGEKFEEQNIVIPLSREEAVVDKVTNVTGGVRLQKVEDVEKKTIHESVRHENVEIDDSGRTVKTP